MLTISIFAFGLGALAAPTASHQHELHYYKRNGMEVPFWQRSSSVSWEPLHGDSIAPLSDAESVKLGVSYLAKKLKVSESEMIIQDSYRGAAANVMHIHVQRVVGGIPVDNQKAMVLVRNGQVVSMNSSFNDSVVSLNKRAASKIVTEKEAIAFAEQQLKMKKDDFPTREIYVELPSGVLAHTYQFQLKSTSSWVQVSVDSGNLQIVQFIDYYNAAKFEAIPIPKKDARDGFEIVSNPEFRESSPRGWNDDGKEQFVTTEGNNVISLLNQIPARSQNGVFRSPFRAQQQPETPDNEQAAVVNSFFICNTMHDILYQYGFDERAGNFQVNSISKLM
jgi:extracellular elastinolytic metalloproteinase